MKQPEPAGWEERLTSLVASQVDRWRGVRGMSARELSIRCSEMGMKVARNTIANLESQRRKTVTVGELLVLAAALNVPPVLLLVPADREDAVEILPGTVVSVKDALAWLNGSNKRARTLPHSTDDAIFIRALLQEQQ